MFSQKAQYLIDSLGSMNINVLVITTMGIDYKDNHGIATIIPVKEVDFKIVIGSIAKTRKYNVMVIDNLFCLYNSYHEIKNATEFLRDIAVEYKMTIFT